MLNGDSEHAPHRVIDCLSDRVTERFRSLDTKALSVGSREDRWAIPTLDGWISAVNLPRLQAIIAVNRLKADT